METSRPKECGTVVGPGQTRTRKEKYKRINKCFFSKKTFVCVKKKKKILQILLNHCF